MNDKNWFVLIIEDSTGKVEKKMGPLSKRNAERVEGGANINLDHERYHTEIRQEAAE